MIGNLDAFALIGYSRGKLLVVEGGRAVTSEREIPVVTGVLGSIALLQLNTEPKVSGAAGTAATTEEISTSIDRIYRIH